MAERNLIGYDNDQVSLNGMLGTMAFQDSDRVEVNNINLDTISGSAALSAISEEIASAAVDVFVYDTTKDSDGGDWRKRTQHTSWYNETLNTTTRGSRREFPVVAVLVLESTKLTIYDGDDPYLPMWMVFDRASNNMLFNSGSVGRKVGALNGHVALANSDALFACSFIDDRGYLVNSANTYESGNILGRNSGYGYNITSTVNKLVSSVTNDVAMTVLPGAPIDDATGLPIPTIAVATEHGASFILDNGFVRDATDDISNSAYSRTPSIDISPDGYAVFPQDTGTTGVDGKRSLFFIPIPRYDRVVDTNSSGTPDKLALWYESSGNSSYPRYSGRAHKVIRRNNTQFITNAPTKTSGLSILSEEQYNPTQGMVDWITSTYNTGWMHGDIKGAFLSDTDTTNVTGSELVTNGTFASDVSGWTTGTSTITYNSGAANIARNSSSSAANVIYQDISGLTIGQKYLVSIKITALSNLVSVYFDPDGSDPTVEPIIANATGTHTAIYTATQTSGKFSINATGNFTATATVDDVSMRVAELDRSVNYNGLAVHGTITKTPVATGADLVAYSGFSNNTNYLSQPNNADLAIGNNNFSSVGWFKKTTSSNTGMIFYASNGSNQVIDVRVHTDMKLLAQITDDNFVTREIVSAQGNTVNDNLWHQYHVARRNNVLHLYLDGVLIGISLNVEANITNGLGITIGAEGLSANQKAFEGSIALIRFSESAPSPEQIKKIYEEEKVLFQENAACTLYGSSNAITALDYDDSTNLLHVGTSSGRSDFQGLRRINNTTTAVTTAISSSNGMIVEQ